MTQSLSKKDQLNQAIRQAEMLRHKAQLSKQLHKNLNYFKKHQPRIFQEYSEHVPTQHFLQLTDAGHINIINKANHSPIFPENPVEYCDDYLRDYLEDPFYKATNPAPPPENKDWLIHSRIVREFSTIIDKNQNKKTSKKAPEHIPLMLMYGLGLGYQLKIMNEVDINHLMILEPHKDIFFASLHTTDWEDAFEHFSKNGKTLLLMIGLSGVQALSDTAKHISTIGAFNISKLYTFNLFNSPKINQQRQNYFSGIRESIANLGFFDDEQISLAHSIENYRAGASFLRKSKLKTSDLTNTPVFICGSGPSLDKEAKFLQQNQNKAIVFSCGSSLKALTTLGVRPDFHIEMERTRPVIEWIKLATHKDFIKDTILLALNTVHPEVIQHFNRRGLCLKANDLGSIILKDALNNETSELYNCNPTVGNAGAAFATAMGFKNIYLFGIDLGFKKEGGHHTKMSLYHDVEEKGHKSIAAFKTDEQGNYPTDGNKSPQVLTNEFYERAKFSMELLLKDSKDSVCYNTSDGVKITGATPINTEDIFLTENIDKLVFSKEIFQKFFNVKGKATLKSNDELKVIFQQVIDCCNYFKKHISPVNDIKDAYRMLDKHQSILNDLSHEKKPYVHQLLKGSVSSISFCLARLLSCGRDDDEALKLFNNNLKLYTSFFDEAIELIETRMFETNQTIKNLKELV